MSPSLKAQTPNVEQKSIEISKINANPTEVEAQTEDIPTVEDTSEGSEQTITLRRQDFTYIRAQTTSFCVDCGGPASYYGRSLKRNFNKRLCATCVEKYNRLLNE